MIPAVGNRAGPGLSVLVSGSVQADWAWAQPERPVFFSALVGPGSARQSPFPLCDLIERLLQCRTVSDPLPDALVCAHWRCVLTEQSSSTVKSFGLSRSGEQVFFLPNGGSLPKERVSARGRLSVIGMRVGKRPAVCLAALLSGLPSETLCAVCVHVRPRLGIEPELSFQYLR